MLKKELEILRARESTLTDYNIGIDSLYRCGIIAFLRAFGRVIRNQNDTVEKIALDGAYSAGFQDALDLLVNFREEFLTPKANEVKVPADYGGLQGAVARGDLTEEEAHELRRKQRYTP